MAPRRQVRAQAQEETLHGNAPGTEETQDRVLFLTAAGAVQRQRLLAAEGETDPANEGAVMALDE